MVKKHLKNLIYFLRRTIFKYFFGIKIKYHNGINLNKSCVLYNDIRVIDCDRNGRITFGRNTTICSHCKIVLSGGGLYIGDNTSLGEYAVINCFSDIFIGNNVIFADKVNIVSNNHIYRNIDIPICEQGIESKPIYINDGCWIGINCTILGGVNIGKNCVVGANTVVNKNIPDYSIVVGNPCKIVKYYDSKLQLWIKQ